MPRKPFESEYLYGLHDPGGERIMRDESRKGWVLFTEKIGHDPNADGGSGSYAGLSNEGFGIIVRLNNGYYPDGTIPHSDHYEDFAQRCARFVSQSPGARIWIIGNETNMIVERPGVKIDFSRELPFAPGAGEPTGRDFRDMFSLRSVIPSFSGGSNVVNPGQTITPELYARCYTLCRNAIHNLPGHEQDLVLIASVAPWNNTTSYPSNPQGDWIQYFQDILALLGPDGCDGITLHTYTHGADPNLIELDLTMGAPFEHRQFQFRTYIDFMEAIPANMRHLPVYITEADEDVEWDNRDKVQWIERAYREIDRWNQDPTHQQIRATILYRWGRFDRWGIDGKDKVIDDFKRAMAPGLKWNPDAAPAPVNPPKFENGQQVFVAMTVNIRRSPGYRNKPGSDVLGQLALRTPATIQSAPTDQDSLTWWMVSSTLSDGTPVQGWVADALTDGRVLLSAEMPPLPADQQTGTFGPGEAVTIVGDERVNVRSTPGYNGKPSTDVVADVQPGAELTIVQGPQEADGLFWWQVSGADLSGWVAEAAPTGVRLLAPKNVSDEIQVSSPFQGQAPMTQGWGSHPTFYSQFKYDGVPLRGHNGLDFGTAMNTPLVAVDEGSVKRTGFDPGGFGNFILLRHEWGESLYAHMEAVHVKQGQPVDSGAVIGLSGNTGASTGPHLHFSIRINPYRRVDGWGGFANPIPFMDLSRSISFGPAEDRDPSPIGEETLENPLP